MERTIDTAYYTLKWHRQPLSARELIRRGVNDISHSLVQKMKLDRRFLPHDRCRAGVTWKLWHWKDKCHRTDCDNFRNLKDHHCSPECQRKTMQEGNIKPLTRKVIGMVAAGVKPKFIAIKFDLKIDTVYGMCRRNGGVHKLRGSYEN